MRKVIEILSGVIALLVGAIGFYFYGKEKGKKQEKQDEINADAKVINDLKKQNDEIDSLPADDVRERMREFTKN